MNAVRLLWQVQLTSLRNAGRYDRRMRVAMVVIFLFDSAVGIWSAHQLIASIAHWQALGSAAVQTGMWSLCAGIWSVISGIAILEGLQQGLGEDTAQLLFTLPIVPASRFRAMYSTFFLRRLWNWLFLEIGITGVALVITLGWQQALTWLVLLQLGVGCVVYASLLATQFLVCAMFASGSKKVRYGLGIVVLSCAFTLVAWLLWHSGSIPLSKVNFWLSPAVISVILMGLLAIAVGPLAKWAGALYEMAFLAAQLIDRSKRRGRLPGIQALSGLLQKYRTLTAALFVKALLGQSRNVMFWGRMAMVLLILFFFPLVHNFLAPYHIADVLLVVGYAAGLALLSILEQAPGALSSEGNRLTLYLVAPLKPTTILRAKLIVFLLPTCIVGILMSLGLSLRTSLPLSQLGFAIIAVPLIITACTTLSIWGSAWDENLNLAIEGTIQMMMQEEAAITARRMGLLNISLLLFIASLLLVWKLPPLLALLALVLLSGIVSVAAWRFGCVQLRLLVRRG